jgi:hypothetical protein
MSRKTRSNAVNAGGRLVAIVAVIFATAATLPAVASAPSEVFV